jgi:hypothetical protein
MTSSAAERVATRAGIVITVLAILLFGGAIPGFAAPTPPGAQPANAEATAPSVAAPGGSAGPSSS